MESYPVHLCLGKRSKGYLVGAIYRQSLIDLGYSPDSHIYDVDGDYFRYEVGSASNLFLEKVRKFYYSLGDFSRRIFLCEFLEKGRHYPFWWLEFGTSRDYQRGLRDVSHRLNEAF